MDLKLAFRMLLKRPAFTLVAVLTLAVGIGANTAIFSVVDGVLLRPLPYTAPDRIVRIFERSATRLRNSASYPNFVDWRQRATSFEAMAAYSGGTATVLGGREPVFAEAYSVTDGFFKVMGVQPELGRTFTTDEVRFGGVPATVVSHRFWQRVLGSPLDLSNARVVVDGLSARVVGVMPATFNYPATADLWIPRELEQNTSGRTSHGLSVVARLRSGVTVERAAAETNTIAEQLKAQYGNDDNAIGTTTMRLRDVLTIGWQQQLVLLLAAVTLVLLIACANVATTMLARGEERRTELAVRAALGAGRGRLVRQLLAESLLVGMMGGAGGLLLAAWLVRVLVSVYPAALPGFAQFGIDWRIMLFALLLALLTPVLFGLIPALQASRGDVRDALGAGGRTGAAPVRGRIRSFLVAAEVAISLLLLVGASLLIRSFVRVLDVDPGFETRGAITIKMALPPDKYQTNESAAQFYASLIDRLRALPGVVQAGATNQLPLTDTDFGGALTFEGHPDEGGQADNEYDGFKYSAGYRSVTPGYQEAIGIRLKQGRLLQAGDRPGQPPVAVVNESFVRKFIPRTNPIGVRFKYAGMDPVNPVFTIVGVTGDIHQGSLLSASSPEVYVSAYQMPFRTRYTLTMVLRAANPSQVGAVASAARETLRQLEPAAPAEIATFDQVLSDSVADRRFILLVLGTFATIALLLAAIGIYSVLSQSVAQRTREIGIRMALGARPERVVRLMLRSALGAVGVGLAVGTVAALAAGRLVEGFLYGVKPRDPMAFLLAGGLLLIVAVIAGYVPARRATRVDPLLALRTQ